MPNSQKYDIIICGGGMAGLSLAYYISRSEILSQKEVLIIESEKKDKNDRTWGYWEKGPGEFDEILSGNWQKARINNHFNESQILELHPYSYKLLKGEHFYKYTQNAIAEKSNITWLNDRVNELMETRDGTRVITAHNGIFKADHIFDSIFRPEFDSPQNQNLIQHFKGYLIETKSDSFNPEIPDLMNFAISQNQGDCTFIYLMPFSKRKALVEYTIFSEKLLNKEEYDIHLKNYLNQSLKNTQYKILEEEFGVIPMSDAKINSNPNQDHFRIGTAGGYTNAATGYTFAKTQKSLKVIIENLEKGIKPLHVVGKSERRHEIYASVLLNVLIKKRYPAHFVFSELYRKNDSTTMFKFLDGETNFWQELKIMSSVRIKHFAKALFQVIFDN